MSDHTEGSYVRCIEIGDGRRTTWWENIAKQGKELCDKFMKDPNFMNSKEVNFLGFSHGGIFARYMVQECLNNGIGPTPRNLITVGSPHMGEASGFYCETVTT